MEKPEILVAGVKTFRREGKAKQARDYVAGLLRDVEPLCIGDGGAKW
jgi:hypothetical protein